MASSFRDDFSGLALTMSSTEDSGPMALPDLASANHDCSAPLCEMAVNNKKSEAFLTSRRQSEPADSENTRLKTLEKPDDLEQLKRRIRDLEEELEELKVKIDHQGTTGNTTKLKADLEKSRQQVKELKKQLSRTESDLIDTRRQMQTLSKQAAVDQRKIKDLQDKEQQLSKSLRALTDDLNKKEVSMKQMKKTVENLQVELKETKRNMHRMEEKFTGMLSEFEKRMNARDAREHRPCTEEAGDLPVSVNVSDDSAPVTDRQRIGACELPPINRQSMNFPPK